MYSFSKLFVATVLAVAVSVSASPAASVPAALCANPTVTTTTLAVDGKEFTLTKTTCPALNVRSAKTAPAPARVINGCGEICTKSCNNDAGTLPPISQDCITIANSVPILESGGQLASTATVGPGGSTSLTFETCTISLTNSNYDSSLEVCWTDLANDGSQAGDACFPPVQPFSSEGVCTAPDWVIVTAHSSSD